MKRNFLLLSLVFSIQLSFSQQTSKPCSPNMRKLAGPTIDSSVLNMQLQSLTTLNTKPYIVKLFVVVFAETNGDNRAAADEEIVRQIENMSDFYRPHDICFILGGIQQVNNSILNEMNAADEENDLLPFLKSGFITIFVHKTLTDGTDNLNGIAYSIPNHYLSIVRKAVNDTANISTLAHEMGHCFGLYHTFEDFRGRENVARSGSCKDCDEDGDFLCDTQADRELDDNVIDEGTCNYMGNLKDACGETLLMEPENIMTYGRRSCRGHFTIGQGSRARGFIITTPNIRSSLAVDNLVVSTSTTINSGSRVHLARNLVTFNADSYIATGSTILNVSAGAIVILPGSTFRPTTEEGYTLLKANKFCR